MTSQRNKFSKLKLRSSASISKKTASPHIDPREKISSYFSLTTTSQIVSEDLFASQPDTQCGQQLSSSSENTTMNDENDFSETKTIKPAKVFEIKVQKESKITRKRPKNKNNLSRFIKDLGPSCSDTNQEHLHLAIAMSKSLEECGSPTQNIETSCSSFPSTQQKIIGIRKTLDQFGFKSGRTPIELPTSKNNTKQKKKFKYLTPTLFLRTEEDRLKLIENKVSGILTNISVYNKNIQDLEEPKINDEYISNKPKSFMLRDYYDEHSILFNKNNLSIEEINESTYYNKIIPKVKVKTGVLLKDWHAIPGREKTPPIDIIVEETEDIVQETQKEVEIMDEKKEQSKLDIAMDGGISPDLFSESEPELTPKINKIDDKSPSSVVLISSNSKNSPLICEKEIFSDDSDAKSLSLLDNISPHRNKKRKSLNRLSSVKKSLFKDTTLDGITLLNTNTSPVKSDSPIRTFQGHENDDSIQPITSQIIDVPVMSENLFSNDFEMNMGGHENLSDLHDTVDLTQSSNDSKKMTPEKNTNNQIESVFRDDLERTELWKENNIINNKSDNSNDSIKTVLLNHNSLHGIENTESINLYMEDSPPKTVLQNDDYSPEFDIINSSNNKEFYDSLNKSPSIVSDSENDLPIENNSKSSTKKSKSFRKSFSENCVGNKEFNFISDADKTDFFKLSSPLNISKFHTEPTILSEEENDAQKHVNDISKSFIDDQNDLQYLSQSSIDTNSDISDEELNYSTNKSFSIKQINNDFMDFNDLPYTGFEPSTLNINNTFEPEVLQHDRIQDLKTPTKLRRSFSESFVHQSKSTPNIEENKTPENNINNSIVITPNNEYIIKTKDVTPMPNYNEMNSPQLRKELDKYGIKPLKRAKGIKMLQYIYDATHPVLDNSKEKIRNSSSDDESGRIIKRRKKNSGTKLIEKQTDKNVVPCIGTEIAESESVEDMIFERKYSVRISSCRIPLHIVWHNLITSNQELHEKILLYEPIQVEEIYAKLKSFGYKFHIQDIITFLDKKCITIRIAQNQKKSAGS